MKIFSTGLLLFLIVLCFCCGTTAQTQDEESASDTVKFSSYIRDSVATVDSLEIHFYIPVNAYANLTATRPLKSDSTTLLVCAAAFTRLDNGRIDGLFMEDGNVITRPVNHSLGGGMIFFPRSTGKIPVIFGTDMGKLLDSAFVDSMVQAQASFCQEIQMVRDGQALVFRKDKSRFQRRAFCIWRNQPVVVETTKPCTLQKFADVMDTCGIYNAIYLDGGSWDEGWFRDEFFKIHTIGLMRNETDRQSNWFVFRSI